MYVKKEQVTVDENETRQRGTELTTSVDQEVVYEEPDIKGHYGMKINCVEIYIVKGQKILGHYIYVCHFYLTYLFLSLKA